MITLDNVVELADANPQKLVLLISALVDDPRYAVPEEIVTPSEIRNAQVLQSYYGNMYAYINTLWGMLRVTAGKDSNRIAVRDFLEKMGSVCKMKYAAASRGLTGFQALNEEGAFGERTI